jgi:hypothetical protein
LLKQASKFVKAVHFGFQKAFELDKVLLKSRLAFELIDRRPQHFEGEVDYPCLLFVVGRSEYEELIGNPPHEPRRVS